MMFVSGHVRIITGHCYTELNGENGSPRVGAAHLGQALDTVRYALPFFVNSWAGPSRAV